MQFEDLKRRILCLDVATICDANKHIRVMDVGIKPIQAGRKLFGVARTASCANDFLTVIKALRDSTQGEVLVIDCQNTKAAVAGQLFSTEAERKGLAGIIVDGAVRDTPMLKNLSLPVYSRYVNSMAGTTTKVFETQISVCCGGVEVNPGDLLFGDEEGVIVSTLDELVKLVPIGEDVQRKEAGELARMQAGHSLLDVLNFDEHYERCSRGEASKLTLA